MPIGTTHVDRVLTDAAVAFFRNNDQFVASQVVAPIPVDRRSDLYQIWNRNDFSRDEAAARADGAEAAVADHSISTDTYYCQRFALKGKAIWAERDNSDDPAGYDRGIMEQTSGGVLLKRERQFLARAALNTSWDSANRFVGTAATDDNLLQFIQFTQANNDPVRVMSRAHDYVRRGTNGRQANVLMVAPNVHTSFLYNDAILQRIKYSGGPDNPALVTPKMLAAVFGVEKYLVPYAVYATNVQGATAAYADVMSNSMVLMYSDGSSKFAPSAMKQFSWTPYDQAKDNARVSVRKYEAIAIESDWIETQIAVDFKITASSAAVHFASVLS